ncbi:SusC/RagA family TonB-linked outer membrane protein [Pedobacter borealis]|uniref:SusC/RagA family TonB-linked outer membrane protein n=1 Tax=Pedobacter borealis TaxID=475254 RepID=UPI001428BEF4|nr:TonB-dependent receptor [Pedobacter borealis]
MKKNYLMIFIVTAGLLIYNVASATIPKGSERHYYDQRLTKGQVKNRQGSALKGVMVSVKGKAANTLTDENGYYSLEADVNDVLIYQLEGYAQQEQKVVAKDINVLLEKNETGEPVDVLFGTHKANTFSGAVSSIKADELSSVGSPVVSNTLAGRLLGLVTSQSISLGNDGSNFSVRNSSPIIIVDGAVRDIDQLNINEIDEITVLKDPVSLAPFGLRSSDGIILVKTKGGTDAKQTINFSAQGALQQPTYLPKYLDSYNYALLANEAALNDGATVAPYSPADLEGYRTGLDPFKYPNNDWYKMALKPSYNFTRFNLNVAGGSSSARYFVALENLNQAGIFKDGPNDYNTNNDFNRYAFRSNVDVDIDPNTTIGLRLAGKYEKSNSPGTDVNSLFNDMRNTPPNAYPVFNPDGSMGGNSLYTKNIYGSLYKTGFIRENRRTALVDALISRKLNFITEGLSLTGSAHYTSYYNQFLNRNRSNFAVYQLNTDKSYTQFGSNANFGTGAVVNSYTRRFNYDAGLNYSRSFNKHAIDATLRYTWDQYDSGTALTGAYAGLMGRVSYDYNEKYFADLAFSYQGSEQYQKGRRYGVFPAISAGYDLAKEDFLKTTAVNQLKLKVSAGLLGYDRASNFDYQPYYSPTGTAYVFGNSAAGVNGWNEQSIGNPNITWEKSRVFNAGIDARFFNSKLGVNLEYFNRRRYDMLQTRGVSNPILGLTYPLENLGINSYKGIELGTDYNAQLGELKINLGANAQLFENKVIFQDELPRGYAYQVRTGERVGQPFGLVALGLFQSQAEINASFPQFNAVLKPGDIKYQDLNGDNKIDDDDQMAIGRKSNPINYSGSLGLKYKGFDFFALVQGVANKDFFFTGNNAWEFRTLGLTTNGTVQEHHLDRWTPATASTATYPRLSFGNNINNHRTSTYWIKNGDYLRLKNVEIGYTLPATLVNRIHFSSLRVFVNAYNAFTLTGLKDIDPEALFNNYPLYRSYTVGVNVKF